MDRAERVGFNEALFRDVNERIGVLQVEFGRTDTMDIVCECGDDQCMERIAIDPQEYRRIREDPTHFVIVPGHQIEDVESVTEDHGHYAVVEKRPGKPARIAEETAHDS